MSTRRICTQPDLLQGIGTLPVHALQFSYYMGMALVSLEVRIEMDGRYLHGFDIIYIYMAAPRVCNDGKLDRSSRRRFGPISFAMRLG